MTAQAFLALATAHLAKFQHKQGCFEEPEIVSHPITGQIGMACKACKRLIVITKVDTQPIVKADGPSEPMPKPRFKI